MFIVLEGVDGAGKTTQAELLRDRLRACSVDVVLTQEPGTTGLGARIRQLVKGNGEPLIIGLRAELLLFGAARAQLVEEVIRPALAQGRTVISDRYIYSTLAYQGAGRGLDAGAIAAVNSIATAGLAPDLVILLDVPVADALARQPGRAADRFDQESVAFYERVRASYRGQAVAEPERWLVVEGARPAGAVADDIWKNVRARLRCV